MNSNLSYCLMNIKHYATSFGYDFDVKMNYFKNRMSYCSTTILLLLFKRLINIRLLILYTFCTLNTKVQVFEITFMLK